MHAAEYSKSADPSVYQVATELEMRGQFQNVRNIVVPKPVAPSKMNTGIRFA
jgi:hypothetical protein